jgi:hypothetical protein
VPPAGHGQFVKNKLAAFPTTNIRVPESKRAEVVDQPATQVRVIQLPREKIIRLEKDSGVKSVEASSGIVWLTGTPANSDVLLLPGERFILSDNWPFVIQALQPADIILAGHFEE